MTSTFNSLGIDNLRFFTGDGHEIIMQKIFSARWEIIPNDRVFSAFYKNPYGHFELSPKKDLSYLMDDEHTMPDGNFTLSGAVDMSDNYQYDVEATAQASTSGLQKAIGEKNLRSVVTLKVKGSINSYDIMVMRNKMDNLHHLDLSDADIKSNSYDYYTGFSTQDDILDPHSFADLDKLLTVKLPKSVKYINQAFNNCSQLRSVEMPENLICVGDTLDNEWSMGGEAFSNCTNLEYIIFHNCEKIGGSAFYQCNSLQEITLPKNLKHVGSYAFSQCI